MANQEHVDILKQGVMAWNNWRVEHKDIIPDLRNAELDFTNLKNVNLRNADLRGALLVRSILSSADLHSADLRNVELHGADLREANLIGANFSGVTFRGVFLQYANLEDANLEGARLELTNVEGANFMDTNLQGAHLEQTNFWDANLDEAIGLSSRYFIEPDESVKPRILPMDHAINIDENTNNTLNEPATDCNSPSPYIKTISQLKDGFIKFDPPRLMKVGSAKEIKAFIAHERNQLIEKLGDQVVIEGLKISDHMSVKLIGSNFSISTLHRTDQVILPDSPTEWAWDVTPNKKGLQKLNLIVSVKLETESDSGYKDFPIYKREIKVLVNHGYTIKQSIKTHWKWGVGLLVGSGILWQVLDRFLGE